MATKRHGLPSTLPLHSPKCRIPNLPQDLRPPIQHHSPTSSPVTPSDLENLATAQEIVTFRTKPSDFDDSKLFQTWEAEGYDGEVLLLVASWSEEIKDLRVK